MLIKARPNLHGPLPDGRTHPSLTVGKTYVVASVAYDKFRVVDDRGEPILVECHLFEVLDDFAPADWIRESDDEGPYWWGPPQCARPGFFEDWHDGHLHPQQVFADVYEQLWRHHEAQLEGQPFVLKRPVARHIPFEVEAVVELPGRGAVVLARRISVQEFTLGSAPKLGGCPILPHLSQPRASTPDGRARQDLFVFKLRSPSDARKLHAGQAVVLEA